MLTVEDWANRYQQQAGWTRLMRNYLLQKFKLTTTSRLLEVGCGTGAVTSDLSTATTAATFGVDLCFPFLTTAHLKDPKSQYTCGDGYHLPYQDSAFDAVCCHFFLLWIKDVPAMLAEMRRVTRKGGFILALAEPDYGGRIDYPDPLRALGQWQSDALRGQGANPVMGRQIMSDFIHSGMIEVEGGLMGGQWNSESDPAGFESEWRIIEADLDGLAEPAQLQDLRWMDESAQKNGERILFVPTFYAAGKNPE